MYVPFSFQDVQLSLTFIARHIRRHEDKDKEAGGEGKGVLLTRKRLWNPEAGYTSKKKRKRSSVTPISPKSTEVVETLEGFPVEKSVSFSSATDDTSDSQQYQVISPELRDQSRTSSSSTAGENVFITENIIDSGTNTFSLPFTTLNDYSWIFEDTPFLKTFNSSIPLNFPLISADSTNQPDLHVPLKLSSSWIDSAENYNFDSDYYAEPIIAILDEKSREKLIKFIIDSTKQEGVALFSPQDEILQPDVLQDCINKFFTKFNITYPLIHCITFKPSEANSLLLTSMILVGASYGSKKIHQAAVKIHDSLRGVLFSSGHFTPNPELWVLQALLLIEVFGKNRAGLKQYEMSHLFNGLLINLIRRSGCQSAVTDPYGPEDETDPEERWKAWIRKESMKRLALLSFLWDVQHATFFSQTLYMSAFELKVALPSDLNLWNSRDSTEWLGHRRAEVPPLSFLSTLKKFLNCSGDLPYINSLSRVLMLHGLMSIAWDMQRRDQTSLNFHIDPAHYKIKLNKAYDHWKQDFDKFSRKIMQKISNNFENTTNKTFFVKYLTTNNAIYHTAVLSLWTNLVDLQIFAGTNRVFGMRVDESTFLKSKSQITEWVYQVGISDKAVMQAAQLLRCGLTNLENWQVDGTFHYPWCLYLSALVCWAFFKILREQLDVKSLTKVVSHTESATPRPTDGQTQGLDGIVDPVIGDSKASMRRFVSLVTSGTPDEIRSRKTICSDDWSGVVEEVANHLRTVRWAIVYDAYKILKGLDEREYDKER